MWRDFDCPICGGRETLKERFYFDSHGNGRVYWKCEACGAESDGFDADFVFLKVAEMLVSVRPRQGQMDEVRRDLRGGNYDDVNVKCH